MVNDIYSTKNLRVNVAHNGNNAQEGYEPTRRWGFNLFFELDNPVLKGSMLTYIIRDHFNNLLLRYSYRSTGRKSIIDFVFWVNNDPANIEFFKEVGIESFSEKNIADIYVCANNEQILAYTNKEKNLLSPEFRVGLFKSVRYAKKSQPGHRELIDTEDRGEAVSKSVIYFRGIKFATKKPATDEEIKKQLGRLADIFTIRGDYKKLSKEGFICFANKIFSKECGVKIVDIEDMQVIINDMKNNKSRGIVATNDPEAEGEAY